MKKYHEVDGKFLFEDYTNDGTFYSATVKFDGTIIYYYSSRGEPVEAQVYDYHFELMDIFCQDINGATQSLCTADLPAEVYYMIDDKVTECLNSGEYFNDWDTSILEDEDNV